MTDHEEWRAVPGWPEYHVSSQGRVMRVAPSANGCAKVGVPRSLTIVAGYLAVTLSSRSKGRKIAHVHRLVALAFLGEPPDPKMQVNHKDSDRTNARLENLEWVTVSENIQHGYRHGNCNARGEANGYSKLTDDTVIEIRTLAHPNRRNFAELAERFNVSKATIYDVVACRTWKHLLAA